jgi:hypothetical protein
LFLLCADVKAQLAGKIIGADSKQPIASASVFLSGTSVGTVTGASGEFIIHKIPQGRFDLVISCIGYETQILTVFSDKISSKLEIKLTPKAEQLSEIIIAQYEKNGWAKWGNFFIESLIGTSDFALKCKFKNTKTVKFLFSKKSNTLKAFADDALIIENNALGYHLRYQLVRFEYNFNTHSLFYEGYPLFQEMETQKKAVKNRWVYNRQVAYYGSMMHFMRCLFRNTLIENGYEVRRLIKTNNKEKERVMPIMNPSNNFDILINTILPGDSIAYAIDKYTAGLAFSNYLQITYTRRREPLGYKNYIKGHTDSLGVVESAVTLADDKEITVFANGSYFNGTDIITMGFWGWWEKLASLLPLDYAN